MTTPIGGLRHRYIHDSLFFMLQNSINSLWSNAQGLKNPINVIPYPLGFDVEVPLNTLAIVDDNVMEDWEYEIGSLFTQYRWQYYVDIFAESYPLMLHLRGDLEAILMGRMASIGRNSPAVDVYDWSQATPPLLFSCQILNPQMERATDWSGTRPWMRFWSAVRFEVWDWSTNEGSP